MKITFNNISNLSALILVTLLFSAGRAMAQRDRIVTQAGEEIRCKILEETSMRFSYSFLNPAGKWVKNEIFKNLVKEFKYNFYETDLVGNPVPDKKRNKEKKAPQSTSQEKPAQKDIELKKTEPTDPQKNSSESDKAGNVAPKPTEIIVNKPLTKTENEYKTVSVQKNGSESDKTGSVTPKPTEIVVNKPLAKNENELKATTSSSESGNTGGVAPKPTEIVVNKPLAKNENELKTTTSSSESDKTGSIAPKPTETVADKALIKEKKEPEKVIGVEVSKANGPHVLATPSLPILSDTLAADNQKFNGFPQWRLGIRGGLGNIWNKNFKAENNYGLYLEKLMKGLAIGGDVAYFPLKWLGLGLSYTDFRSVESADNLFYINDITGKEITGHIENHISKKFIGPMLFVRKALDHKTYAIVSAGPGMIFYSDKGLYEDAHFDFRGKVFGAASTVGLDFLLGKSIHDKGLIISLEAGYNYGRMKKLDRGEGPVVLSSPMILDHLDLTLGLRWGIMNKN